MFSKSSSEIAISLLLLLPIVIYYLAHYYSLSDSIGTGFIQGDMISYMANARQHFDEGKFHLLYSNPFGLDANGPHIYFQIQTLLLGVTWYFTQGDIGIIFVIFGLVSAVLSIWVSLRLFKSFLGWNTYAHKLTFLLFIYGGGLLIISGFVYSVTQGHSFKQSALDCLMFDPGGGFWMLNFGRNFIYPMEAYYHLLSMAILFNVYKQRQPLVSILIFILAISHPFYGIQFLMLILSWQILDKMLFKNKEIEYKYIIINGITFLLFLYYYTIFLPKYPSHNIITQQWAINWNFKAISIILAYILVLVFFIYQVKNKSRLWTFFKQPFHRFLLLYACGSLILANHDLFINPIQPLHFTHGHIYIPLFLLAAKGIIPFFQKKKSIIFRIIQFGVLIIMFSDNSLWFTAQYYKNYYNKQSIDHRIMPLQKNLIHFIKSNYDFNYILISEFSSIDYFAASYTSVNTILPHSFNTPFVKDRITIWKQFFEKKQYFILPKKKIIVVDNLIKNGLIIDLKTNPNFAKVFSNKDYILYERINYTK